MSNQGSSWSLWQVLGVVGGIVVPVAVGMWLLRGQIAGIESQLGRQTDSLQDEIKTLRRNIRVAQCAGDTTWYPDRWLRQLNCDSVYRSLPNVVAREQDVGPQVNDTLDRKERLEPDYEVTLSPVGQPDNTTLKALLFDTESGAIDLRFLPVSPEPAAGMPQKGEFRRIRRIVQVREGTCQDRKRVVAEIEIEGEPGNLPTVQLDKRIMLGVSNLSVFFKLSDGTVVGCGELPSALLQSR